MAGKSVTVIGSGNFGMAIATIIAGNTERHADFAKNLTIWMFDEEVEHKGKKRKLSELFNETNENVKYLPGVTLPSHVKAEPDLKKAVKDADILVWVLPPQFVPRTVQNIGLVKDDCVSVSLVKGGLELADSKLGLCSDMLRKLLGHEVAVLMGANVASEVAAGKFCEATLGLNDKTHEAILLKLFNCRTFHVNAIDDIAGVELCGALQKVVALGAGFCDGMDYGGNTKAALIRIGLQEMKSFIRYFYPEVKDATFLESCGVADLITSCFGGRNRKCAEAFVRARGTKSWDAIEKELLGGQKLGGTHTLRDIWPVMQTHNLCEKLPLLATIYRIAFEEMAPWCIVKLPQGIHYSAMHADDGWFENK